MTAFAEVPELPERVLHTYARLWQLEIWLRRLVYVELRARFGDDWRSRVGNWEGSKDADKRLTHMPTPEDDPLSYTQLSGLCKIVSSHWDMFSAVLPPQTIWNGKLEEIKQIRHRVAHFRVGHEDDLARVLQLLRDLDKGFWTFCTSYNDTQPVLPASRDPVVQHFLDFDPFPWSQVGDREWARIGCADPNLRVAMTVEVLKRPWATWAMPAAGHAGLLYDVVITARSSGRLNYPRFLGSTLKLHKRVAHICLDRFCGSARLTIPAILGEAPIITLIEGFHAAALNTLGPAPVAIPENSVQAFADSWPEYVLGPENPLSFLTSDMPCHFFGV